MLGAFPELLYPLHTSRLAVISPPRRAILRRATRTAKCFDTVFCEAEGSAPLHRRAIQDCLEDRLP